MQGPHNESVRVCPCAEVYYCSGSCQRLHYPIHRETCCREDGPWGLRGTSLDLSTHVTVLTAALGAISLDDTFFICSSTRFFIITAFSMIREQIIEALAPRRKAVKPPLVRQPVIFFDLTNILSGGRSQVYLRTSYMPDATPRAHSTILSEVALRAGKHSITKTIPLILDLEDFGISQ